MFANISGLKNKCWIDAMKNSHLELCPEIGVKLGKEPFNYWE
jgi:hypothetical protein